MAKYAFGIYGDPSFKYGQSDADRLFYSSQLTAWAYDYGVISLRWKAVTANPASIALGETLTHWRLTKTFTGTPDGIGAAQGKFLKDGDIITTTIAGIGTMVNHCRRVSDYVKGA